MKQINQAPVVFTNRPRPWFLGLIMGQDTLFQVEGCKDGMNPEETDERGYTGLIWARNSREAEKIFESFSVGLQCHHVGPWNRS